MLKRDEVAMPDSCLNKARDNEFVFVLLERDNACPDTIRFWAKRRCELGLNKPTDDKIVQALITANQIKERRYRANEARRATECSGHGRGGQTTCCDRAGEYNGFGSGPSIFTCPQGCACHD